MTGPTRRFDPSELQTPGESEPSVAELARALAAARELEAMASDADVHPTDDFEDRVMAAIAVEAAPKLVVRPGSAVRGGRAGAVLLAIRDSWRVATGGGRPWAVRAQALAFVLLIVLAAGALTGVTAMTVGGLLDSRVDPSPSTETGPTISPPPSPTETPTTSPSPSDPASSTEPTESAEPDDSGEPTETSEAAETPRPTQTAKPTGTGRPTRTPEPTETAEPDGTSEPHGTPEPTNDDGEETSHGDRSDD